MNEIIIKGEKGRTFKIDLKDPIQKRYELVRELNLSSKKREEIVLNEKLTKFKDVVIP
jgi:hypothetical protein